MNLCSRRIVGWAMEYNMTTALIFHALDMALHQRQPQSPLIHHSDRGSQYYSAGYIKLLEPYIKISMTEHSDPLENAIAERVNGILKDELLEQRFETFSEAQRKVAVAISTYNHLRPHSSIDMLTPAVAHTKSGTLKKHWKNYYSVKNGKEVTIN